MILFLFWHTASIQLWLQLFWYSYSYSQENQEHYPLRNLLVHFRSYWTQTLKVSKSHSLWLFHQLAQAMKLIETTKSSIIKGNFYPFQFRDLNCLERHFFISIKSLLCREVNDTELRMKLLCVYSFFSLLIVVLSQSYLDYLIWRFTWEIQCFTDKVHWIEHCWLTDPHLQ